MREEFEGEPMISSEEEETDTAENLDLEESEFDEEENSYLVQDDELSEEFQFQG